jgi:exopolysaccharide biosynthesis protein
MVLAAFASFCLYRQPFHSTAIPGERPAIIHHSFQRGTEQVECVFARFRDAEFELHVIDNGWFRVLPRFRDLADAMERRQCVVGTNGGFFDGRTFRPNGLSVADGKRTGEFDPKNWAAGVLAVREGALVLADQAEFIMDASVTQLVQTGPWLVRAGTSQSGFTNDDAPARRTFIATDGAGTWLLGHVGGCTLHELSSLLTSPPLKEILPIREALNLDGGPSSSFWFAGEPTPTYLHEQAIVRNYVGIRPRKAVTASPR